MEILYEDSALWVAVKPPMLLSEETPDKKGFADMLAAKNSGYVGVVHRLDRGVGGIMVYAKTKSAAAALSRAVQEHRLEKEYWALVHGIPEKGEDTLRDLLFHDRRQNKTFVVEKERSGVKEAILDYTVLKVHTCDPYGELSLLRVKLHTGRTHQIRVQFSSRGHSLLGDGKYGASGDRCPIALYSHRLSFPHPTDGTQMTFEAIPSGDIWDSFITL